jgi:hypothetical protein
LRRAAPFAARTNSEHRPSPPQPTQRQLSKVTQLVAPLGRTSAALTSSLLTTNAFPCTTDPVATIKVASNGLRAGFLLVGLGLTALAAQRQSQHRQRQLQGTRPAMDLPGPGGPRRRHLDLAEGREVVFCHNCSNEWYNDDHGLQCPRCHSEICEIVRLPTYLLCHHLALPCSTLRLHRHIAC